MTFNTQNTLAAFKAAQKSPIDDPAFASLLAKSTFAESGSPTTGLTFYDLEPGAKMLVPVLTPLRNDVPRVTGKGGIQANWKAITGLNTASVRAGISPGNRGGVIAVTTQDYNAIYKGIGLEANVDFEAVYAGQGFDDLRAVAAQTLLESLMLQEEQIILGGNGSLALATTPTPSLTASSSGGSLATGTLSVIGVALTLDGYLNSSVAGGIPAAVTRTNADGSSDTFGGGSAQKSANATVSVTGPSGSVAATVAAVRGAVGYAWFWGAAGSETLGAITTINSVSIAANAAGTQAASALPSSDNSVNALVFDGLLTQCFKPALNAYYAAQPTGTAGTGTPLTADSEGGIVEFDAALKSFWDNYRLSPTAIYVSSQEMLNIHKKILQGGTNTAARFVFAADQGAVLGGVMVRSYLNKFSMAGATEIPIRLHPNMPAGTVLFFTKTLPYPLSNVPNTVQIRTRRDYYQVEWPLRARRYEYGVYADEVLQNYAPFAFGAISNIGNG
ncbi:MAG TPA: hypothetical protein VGR79_04330 [Stellaceae bacterium]|nr:hypothetical protein [Stellaceae bacterium]